MKVSFHPGVRADETILFTCADSGGVCLAWFQENIATELPYEEFERELWVRGHRDAPLFLPYLTGVNPPDFVADARGAFLGLQLRHDRIDLAYAVMEGVAHLLRRNLDHFAEHGQRAGSIVSAGGGTASRFWNQLKANVCGLDFRTPEEPEAACRGAAVLALVAAGALDSIDDTAHLHRPAERTSHPRDEAQSAVRYREFETALATPLRKGSPMIICCSSPMVPGATLTEKAERLREWGYDAMTVIQPRDEWNDAVRRELGALEGRTGVRPVELVLISEFYGRRCRRTRSCARRAATCTARRPTCAPNSGW